jgi:hypothetical protein
MQLAVFFNLVTLEFSYLTKTTFHPISLSSGAQKDGQRKGEKSIFPRLPSC